MVFFRSQGGAAPRPPGCAPASLWHFLYLMHFYVGAYFLSHFLPFFIFATRRIRSTKLGTHIVTCINGRCYVQSWCQSHVKWRHDHVTNKNMPPAVRGLRENNYKYSSCSCFQIWASWATSCGHNLQLPHESVPPKTQRHSRNHEPLFPAALRPLPPLPTPFSAPVCGVGCRGGGGEGHLSRRGAARGHRRRHRRANEKRALVRFARGAFSYRTRWRFVAKYDDLWRNTSVNKPLCGALCTCSVST